MATLEKDLSCLGKTDVIAINGGANNTESKGNRINRVLVNMLKFMQKYATTNIIIVNIPHRYDKNWNSVTNSDIQACNRKLNKIVERFSHVTVVGVDSIRKHFTQQGMHLNKKGKEWISRLIATQINKLTTGKNGDTHEITLNWKDELPNKQTIVQVQSEPKSVTQQINNSQTIHVHPEPKTETEQINNSQTDETHKETIVGRTSGRQKKTPITRNKDFLWEQ